MSKYQQCIRKIEMNYVPVNSVGFVSSSDFIHVIRLGKTVLVTLILSNNKARSLQTVYKVATLFWELQVMLHTDDLHCLSRETPLTKSSTTS